MPDRQTAEKLFLEQLPWIDRVAAMTCKQHGVWDADAEDFAGWMQMRVIEDDYAVIRSFRGESELKTYLASVVNRQFHEYGRQRWGRWRVSAKAEQLGPPAPELETLVQRDGYTLEQAGRKLRTAGRTTLSDAELARLLAQLRDRGPLRPVEVPPATRDDALATAEAPSQADERVTAAEEQQERRRVLAALGRALEALEDEDRIIVTMHFQDGYSVADVARTLNLEQKPLYRRVDRLRARLRQLLEQEGVRGVALPEEREEP
ncbi:MAG TPA: sigma-70 family RNA polymerase sigma factor [Longimicrobium sp.]